MLSKVDWLVVGDHIVNLGSIEYIYIERSDDGSIKTVFMYPVNGNGGDACVFRDSEARQAINSLNAKFNLNIKV